MTREEAINEIKSWDFLNEKESEAIQTLIPELRESEDERMRKRAIAILKQQRDYWSYDGPVDKFPPATPRKDLVDAIDVALSYLEKQKEQKPAWSEEDTDMLNCCISSIEEAKENRYAYKETDGDTSYDREIDWLTSLRPSWKPSEEQMDRILSIVAALRKDYCDDMADFLANLYAGLKKLGVKEEPEYYQHFDPDC